MAKQEARELVAGDWGLSASHCCFLLIIESLKYCLADTGSPLSRFDRWVIEEVVKGGMTVKIKGNEGDELVSWPGTVESVHLKLVELIHTRHTHGGHADKMKELGR